MLVANLRTFLKTHWRGLLNLAVILGLVGLALAEKSDIANSLDQLTGANKWYLLLLIPIEFLNYDAQARLYQNLYKIVKSELRYWPAFKLSLELNFINTVFPSGGVSGITYFSARMRGGGRSGSQAAVMQIMKLMMTFLAFELVLAIGLIILAAAGHVNQLVILIASALTMATFAGILFFVFVITSAARVGAFARFLVRFLGLLANWSHISSIKKLKIERLKSIMDDMHQNYKQLENNLRQLQPAFWHAFLMSVWEVLAVFVSFAAFGNAVNIGAIILAYAVANFAGVVSIFPGGAGVYEILMTSVLVAGGVPAGLALPVVVIYRLVSSAIQLPPGYFLYRRGIAGGRI